MVPETGFEPVRSQELGILSPLCLPFHHSGHLIYAPHPINVPGSRGILKIDSSRKDSLLLYSPPSFKLPGSKGAIEI